MTKKEMKQKIAFQMADTMFTALFHEVEMNDREMASKLRTRVQGMYDTCIALGLKAYDVQALAGEIYSEQFKDREKTLKPRN